METAQWVLSCVSLFREIIRIRYLQAFLVSLDPHHDQAEIQISGIVEGIPVAPVVKSNETN